MGAIEKREVRANEFLIKRNLALRIKRRPSKQWDNDYRVTFLRRGVGSRFELLYLFYEEPTASEILEFVAYHAKCADSLAEWRKLAGPDAPASMWRNERKLARMIREFFSDDEITEMARVL